MHPTIPSTIIKLAYFTKIFVLSIFDWSFYTGFTVLVIYKTVNNVLVIKGLFPVFLG